MGRGDGDRNRRTYTNFKRQQQEENTDYQPQENDAMYEGRNGPYNRRGNQGPSYRGGHSANREWHRSNRREDRFSNRIEASWESSTDVEAPGPKTQDALPQTAADWPSLNYDPQESQDAWQQEHKQGVALEKDRYAPPSRPPADRPPPSASVAMATISRTITNENIPMVTTPATRMTNTVTERKSYSQGRHPKALQGVEGERVHYEEQQKSTLERETGGRMQQRAAGVAGIPKHPPCCFFSFLKRNQITKVNIIMIISSFSGCETNSPDIPKAWA